MGRVATQLLEPLRAEIAADGRYRAPGMEELWALHGGVVYLGIRRHIYRLPTPGDDGPVVEANVARFLAGLLSNGTPPDPVGRDLRPAKRAEAPNGARRQCGAAKRAEARAGD
jgi:hypothetical protein